jgi:hypothetical protein
VVLAALRLAKPEEVHLECNPIQATPHFCRYLGTLTSLDTLYLHAPKEDGALPHAVAAALGRLRGLESLDTALHPTAVQLLPPALKSLAVKLYPHGPFPAQEGADFRCGLAVSGVALVLCL